MRDDLADLLEGLEGAARTAQAALIDDLLTRGATEQELRAAHAQQRLELLPLERVLREEGSSTLEDVAAAYGVDADALAATRRALGLPTERGRPVYGTALEEHAQRLRFALGAGMPLEALVTINRTVGRSMAAIAVAARDAIQTLLEESDSDSVQRALRAAQATEALTPQLQRVLTYAFLEHVRELVRHEAGATLLAAGAAPDVRHVAVAFADLVGFTSIGDEMAPEQLSSLADRLEILTLDALGPDVTLVKTIGDEVMLTSPDSAALVHTVLELLAAGNAQGDGFPRLRAGAAAGPAMSRAGDWYGRTVNLASRLTALAAPGTLLAEDVLRAGALEAATWSAGSSRAIRGLTHPVATYTAAPERSVA